MEKLPIIAVVGPTASGKTGLAIELAKKLDESRTAGAKKVLEKNAAICEKYNKA